MKRPVALIDCDGPLANFTQGYLDAVHFLTGHIVLVEQVDRWHIHECPWFVELAKVRPSLKRDVEDIIEKEGFCQQLEMVHHARQALEVLREVTDVYVVTSPWQSSKTWAYDRCKWLKRNFDISASHVISTQQKHLVQGQFFVDDKVEHVMFWDNAMGGNGEAYLFDLPHNRNQSERVCRGFSWRGIVDNVDAWMWHEHDARLGDLLKKFDDLTMAKVA